MVLYKALPVVNAIKTLTGGDKSKCLKLRKVRFGMLYVALHKGDFGGIFKECLMGTVVGRIGHVYPTTENECKQFGWEFFSQYTIANNWMQKVAERTGAAFCSPY